MIHLRNCTAQHQVVTYRLDIKDEHRATLADRRNFRRVDVKPWGTGFIDVEKVMVQGVLDQLGRYGIQAEADVPNRLVGVVPLIWNIAQPVDARAAQQVIEHNRSHKAKEGQDRRKKAAIAANNAVIQQLNETGQSIDAAPQGFEVELEQTVDSETEATGQRMEEGFRVQASPQGRGPGSRPRRAA